MKNRWLDNRICKPYLRTSTAFWLCNVFGWLIYGLVETVRNAFDRGPLKEDVKSSLVIAFLGICSGYLVHCLYRKRFWVNRHPLHLIPMAGGIAIVFGVIAVAANQFDLVMQIHQICASDTPRPPYSCGAVSNLFLQSMSGMLIWCIFYFLLQWERRADESDHPDALVVGKALLILILLNHLGIPFSIMAYTDWGSNHYLFSEAYFFDSLMNLIPIVSAAYILFVRSKVSILGSRILPLVPLLMAMAFCCMSLNIELAGAMNRIRFQGLDAGLRYILWGTNYGAFSGPGHLAGVVEGGAINSLSMTLFFLCLRSGFKGDGSNEYSPHGLRKAASMWGYSLLFWSVFGLLVYGTDLMELGIFIESAPMVSTLSCIGVGMILGVLLRLQVAYFVARSASGFYLTVTITIASIFAGILLTYSIWLINDIYIWGALEGRGIERFANFVNNPSYLLSSFLSSAVLCGLWSFVCFMVESLARQRESALKQIQLERNMRDVRLNTLAGRVDPHFIFNALNNIRALVDEDGEKARSAISALSDILRSPITASSQDKITLAEEMLLVRHYVSLAKIQYEERLRYTEDLEDGIDFALIPAMLLQILVENAIKHGISRLVSGGKLTVLARRLEDNLFCEVRNQGSLDAGRKVHGFGVGTGTIYERLALLYGNQARFRLYEAEGYVTAELVLPFEKSKSQTSTLVHP